MNDDLISRSAAIEQIERREKLMTDDRRVGVEHFKTFLMNRPAVDAEPVRHGRWIFKSTYYDSFGDLIKEYTCSDCGRYVQVYDEATKDPYCPECGAKMDMEG